MKLRQQVAGWLVYGVIRLIAVLPLAASQWIGRRIGDMSWRFNTRAAKITRVNLALCFPDLSPAERDQLAHESLQQTGMMLMETPASWFGDQGRMLGWIQETVNFGPVDDAIRSDRGVIIILPHIGNWELVNVFLSRHERQKDFVGLYAPPNQDYMKKLISEVRLRFGNEVVPTTKKGLATILRRLREGKLVVLLPDQVPATGEMAPFFGEETLTDAVTVRMLERCPSAIAFTCTMERLGGSRGFRVNFDDPHPDIYTNDRTKALAALNASVEACVRKVPAQYQWEYKRFKHRPAGTVRIYNFKGDAPTHH